jgi:PDZ domain
LISDTGLLGPFPVPFKPSIPYHFTHFLKSFLFFLQVRFHKEAVPANNLCSNIGLLLKEQIMKRQILGDLKFLGGLAIFGIAAAIADAQVVSAPANFKSGPGASRQAYSYAPPAAPNGIQQGGYKISSLTPGLAADRYGLKVGDVIIQVNGKTFRSEDEFNGLLRQSSIGSKITYFEAGTGIVKMREVRHLFARLGTSGQIVALSGPPVLPGSLPPGVLPPGALPPGAIPAGAIPPGPIGLPPGAIVPPTASGPVLPGV